MEKIEFKKKDGTKGEKFRLEDGDIFKPLYSEPLKTSTTPYENWAIKATVTYKNKNQEALIALTKTQANQLIKLKDVKDKVLRAEKYTSVKHPGEYIGIREAK